VTFNDTAQNLLRIAVKIREAEILSHKPSCVLAKPK